MIRPLSPRSISLKISYSAIFGALAATISFLHIRFPMPILFWLEFDFAEIPDFIAYYIGGFNVGVATAFIHCLILNLGNPVHPIVGPLAKFSAVVSMMIGISFLKKFMKEIGLITQLLSAMIFRVTIMTFVNILIFYVFIPSVLQALPKILAPFFGKISTVEVAFLITLGLTGIYNALHTIMTVIIANRIFVVIRRYLGL